MPERLISSQQFYDTIPQHIGRAFICAETIIENAFDNPAADIQLQATFYGSQAPQHSQRVTDRELLNEVWSSNHPVLIEADASCGDNRRLGLSLNRGTTLRAWVYDSHLSETMPSRTAIKANVGIDWINSRTRPFLGSLALPGYLFIPSSVTSIANIYTYVDSPNSRDQRRVYTEYIPKSIMECSSNYYLTAHAPQLSDTEKEFLSRIDGDRNSRSDRLFTFVNSKLGQLFAAMEIVAAEAKM